MIKEKCGNNIESIINPESVAVVETASRLEPIGLTTLKNLLQTGCRGI
jgi:acyl-CoA synthetase (NDP forming)